jgi:excinuclease ABC subunit C
MARRLDTSPGVYRMLGHDGQVLYVGKAKGLKSRVLSYTRANGLSHRLTRMVAETRNMEIITTRTEVEALLLESNLIKTLKPRFNILLRDDKSFPYIMITRDHEWAQINKHRGSRKRKAWWFGPFCIGQRGQPHGNRINTCVFVAELF